MQYKNAYKPNSNYFYLTLWPYIHQPNLAIGSVASLPNFAQAASTHFEPETG